MKPAGRGPWSLSAALAGAGLVFTAIVVTVPAIRLAYLSQPLHVMLSTIIAVIAIFAAFVMGERFRARRQLRDLVLTFALGLAAFTNLFFDAFAGSVLRGDQLDAFWIWSSLLARPISACALAASPFLPERTLGRPSYKGLFFALALTVLGTMSVVGIASLFFPLGIAALAAEQSRIPRLEGHPLVILSLVSQMILLSIATIGFVRRAHRDQDEMLRWFGAGTTLGTVAYFNYLLFPSLYTDYVYTGDYLRLGHYLMFLIGGSLEIVSYSKSLAEARIDRQRKVLAVELHTGLAQDLLLVAFKVRDLLSRHDRRTADEALKLAERALSESRRAIEVLSAPVHEGLDEAIARAAENAASSSGVRLHLSLNELPSIEPEKQDALVRFVWEVVRMSTPRATDAVLKILLSGPPTKLRIEDPRGLPDLASDPYLTGITQKLRELGGRIHIGEGLAAVEVTLP